MGNTVSSTSSFSTKLGYGQLLFSVYAIPGERFIVRISKSMIDVSVAEEAEVCVCDGVCECAVIREYVLDDSPNPGTNIFFAVLDKAKVAQLHRFMSRVDPSIPLDASPSILGFEPMHTGACSLLTPSRLFVSLDKMKDHGPHLGIRLDSSYGFADGFSHAAALPDSEIRSALHRMMNYDHAHLKHANYAVDGFSAEDVLHSLDPDFPDENRVKATRSLFKAAHANALHFGMPQKAVRLYWHNAFLHGSIVEELADAKAEMQAILEGSTVPGFHEIHMPIVPGALWARILATVFGKSYASSLAFIGHIPSADSGTTTPTFSARTAVDIVTSEDVELLYSHSHTLFLFGKMVHE